MFDVYLWISHIPSPLTAEVSAHSVEIQLRLEIMITYVGDVSIEISFEFWHVTFLNTKTDERPIVLNLNVEFPNVTEFMNFLRLSDLVFILLFPHLVMVVHCPSRTNKYGMILGFTVALILRVLSGEPVLKYNAIIKYYGYVEPHYDDSVSLTLSFFSISA